jgi:hypothetical protein
VDRCGVALHQMRDRAVNQLLLFDSIQAGKVVGYDPNHEMSRAAGLDRDLPTRDSSFDCRSELLHDVLGNVAENFDGHREVRLADRLPGDQAKRSVDEFLDNLDLVYTDLENRIDTLLAEIDNTPRAVPRGFFNELL